MSNLGRLLPPDFDHLDKYPLRALTAVSTPKIVEKTLILPKWIKTHNQGSEGACVAFGSSLMMTILNENECRKQGQKDPYIRYNPWWLWDKSKEIDGIPETNPGDTNGTTVRASCEILRTHGHVLWPNETDPKSMSEPIASLGIAAYRWASSVDDIRYAIDQEIPISMGVNWYANFDKPLKTETASGFSEFWIGQNNLGLTRGGHCVCIYGISDLRQAVLIRNSWGESYPDVWMPYETVQRLIHEDGEFALITDK